MTRHECSACGTEMEIEPCLFCDEDKNVVVIQDADTEMFYVKCRCCEATGPVADREGPAIDGWNDAWEEEE